jgi:putative transposase
MSGELHHVLARGAAKQEIFLDATDYRRYLALLSRTCRCYEWRCLSYCLMSNHVHLLVEATIPNLSRGMHRLQGGYAQFFNQRHDRSGHVFQGRFKTVEVKSDEQLWTLVRYIVDNPVAAGLCAEPEDWRWSSHAAIVDGHADPCLDETRLFAYLESYGGEPRHRYLEFLKGARPL